MLIILQRGDVYLRTGHGAVALASYQRCATLGARTLGATNLAVGLCRTGEADALLALGRPRPALAAAMAGLAIVDHADADPALVAAAQGTYGRALAATGDQVHARAELAQALALYATAGAGAAEARATVERALRRLR